VLTNRRGRAMLAARDGLSTDCGRLTAAVPTETKHVRDLCAAVAATLERFPRHPGGALRLTRPSGRPALEMLVTPTSSEVLLGSADKRVTANVFVSDPADQPRPSTVLLERCYGLTRAEADVASRLAIGLSLEQIAGQRRSAIETVRRQKKQILSKTGAQSRSELVRRLTMLPSLFREDAQ
jgi:DNA-binding CsgD family transcriptional regulator